MWIQVERTGVLCIATNRSPNKENKLAVKLYSKKYCQTPSWRDYVVAMLTERVNTFIMYSVYQDNRLPNKTNVSSFWKRLENNGFLFFVLFRVQIQEPRHAVPNCSQNEPSWIKRSTKNYALEPVPKTSSGKQTSNDKFPFIENLVAVTFCMRCPDRCNKFVSRFFLEILSQPRLTNRSTQQPSRFETTTIMHCTPR